MKSPFTQKLLQSRNLLQGSLSRVIVASALFCLISSEKFSSAHAQSVQWVGGQYLVTVIPGRKLVNQTSVLVDSEGIVHKTIPNLSAANISHTNNSQSDVATYIIWNPLSPSLISWHNGAFYAIASGSGTYSLPSNTMHVPAYYSDIFKTDNSDWLLRPLAEKQNDSYYIREDGSKYHRWFFAKQEFSPDNDGSGDNTGWQYLGHFDTMSDEVALRAIPCNDDRFIVFSSRRDLYDNNRPNRSPFVRISPPSNNKNEFRMVSSIDHGLDDFREYMSDEQIIWQAYMGTGCSAMTNEYAIIINPYSGLYWVFSKEKASLVKAGCLFKKSTFERLIKGGHGRVVHLANPQKDGTVLVSADDEDFLLTADNLSKEFMDLQQSGYFESNDNAAKWYAERQRERDLDKRYITWYCIYPENGKLEKLPIPPEGGMLSKEEEAWKVWFPMSDGSVKHDAALIANIQEKVEEKLAGKNQEEDAKGETDKVTSL